MSARDQWWLRICRGSTVTTQLHIYIEDQWWLHMYVGDQRWPHIYVGDEPWSGIYVGD